MTRIFSLILGALLASLLGLSSFAHAGEERSKSLIIAAEQSTVLTGGSDSIPVGGGSLPGDQVGFAHHHGECHSDRVNARHEAIPFQIAIDRDPSISRNRWLRAGVIIAPGLRPPNA